MAQGREMLLRVVSIGMLLGALALAGLGLQPATAAPPFFPEIEFGTSSKSSDSPTGLDVTVHVPQDLEGYEQASANLHTAVVRLPVGMGVSPSAADGLESCTDEQFGITSFVPFRTNNNAPTCPEGSKIGTAAVDTHLLEHPEGPGTPNLRGTVWLASQKSFDPMSGDMYRIFMRVMNVERGVYVKLMGRVTADPVTGQLTTTVADSPPLPFTYFTLSLNGGKNATLVTPQVCGVFTAEGWMSPSTVPTKRVYVSDTFNLSKSPGEKNCTSSAARPFNPSVRAGSQSPKAGAYTGFNLEFGRQDGEQGLSTLKVEMPEGLLAMLNGFPLCSAERAQLGTCGAESRVGRVEVAAGAGPSPLQIPQVGKSPTAVYLSGAYGGAPYSLSVVVPAQAGPFDLGTTVIRSPLHVNDRTAVLTATIGEARHYNPDGSLDQVVVGAMPKILKGVPLRLRGVRVIIDRKQFMFNPTSCAEKKVLVELGSDEGATSSNASRFQVGECAKLGFTPKFRMKILNKGRKSTRRSFNPRVRFTLAPKPGDANIDHVQVTLPHAVILDQSHIKTVCTRAQFAERRCPQRSIYGYAKAWSPVLNKSLEGPVYLGSSPNPLPDLIADLNGEVRIVLQGKIDTAKGGRIRNTFDVVPDAPVSRFELTMNGGKNGILVNSTDLCRANRKGVADFTAQNGRFAGLRPPIGLSFKGCAKVRKAAARGKSGGKSGGKAKHK